MIKNDEFYLNESLQFSKHFTYISGSLQPSYEVMITVYKREKIENQVIKKKKFAYINTDRKQ